MEETREERIAKLVKEVQELLEREFPEKGSTMQHIEELTEKIGREIEGRIEEEATEQESRGYEGSYVVCKCGWTARYVRDYEKRVVTLHGERTVTRAYYYCSGCKKGFCPIDETLELDGGCTTMAVRAKIARLAALVPFPDAPRQVGRCALALGPSGGRTELSVRDRGIGKDGGASG